jgi:molybdenum cofactor guanylyltransferase
METDIQIRSLILVGGRSTRMGFPKHLLRTSLDSGSQSLLYHTAEAHRGIAQNPALRRHYLEPITISVRDEIQKKQLLNYMTGMDILKDAGIVVDTEDNVGPSAGLLSAHRLDPSAHWVVTGCDYPRVTTEALLQLVSPHLTGTSEVTCFVNTSQFVEPLLAVWSPSSLAALQQTLLIDQNTGPSQVIRKLAEKARTNGSDKPVRRSGVETIIPRQNIWIEDINTIEAWQKIQAQ